MTVMPGTDVPSDPFDERLIEADALSPEDREFDVALRPRTLDDFVGQDRVKEQLKVLLKGASQRNDPVDHLLFSGPPGLGKTTLAQIVAIEMGAGFQPTSGPALERPSDLAAILTNLGDGDVLFVDEIHRMPRAVEEVLYPALEDYSLDVVLGKGPTARSIRLDLPRFTLIAATTRPGRITLPLRERFGFSPRLDYYGAEDLTRIVLRSAGILGVADGRGGRRGDRPPLARHPADREPAAAPGARLRRGAPRRRDHRRYRPGRARRCSRSTSRGSIGSTTRSSGRSSSGSRGGPVGSVHAGRGGRRGAGHRRGRGRALPDAAGVPAAHTARPGRRPPRAYAHLGVTAPGQLPL